MSQNNDNGGGMAKEIKLTVMIDEQLDDQLKSDMRAADVNTSDLVRACLHVGLPILRDYPSLIHIVPTVPSKTNQRTTR